MSFCFRILFLLPLVQTASTWVPDFNQAEATCHHNPNAQANAAEAFYRRSIFENAFCLMLMILFFIFFILLLLGMIKGIFGLYSKPIGEFGLPMLIDLPKPLDKYQENDLWYRPVVYDVGGWPVHPETRERTVRVLPNNVMFCLNVIFFLAYPLALLVSMCALCCCIKSPNTEYDENIRYKKVNVIKLSKCPFKAKKKHSEVCCTGMPISPCPHPAKDQKREKCSSIRIKFCDCGSKVDRYTENDPKEAEDTDYVLNEYKKTHSSLQDLRKNRSDSILKKERSASNSSFKHLQFVDEVDKRHSLMETPKKSDQSDNTSTVETGDQSTDMQETSGSGKKGKKQKKDQGV